MQGNGNLPLIYNTYTSNIFHLFNLIIVPLQILPLGLQIHCSKLPSNLRVEMYLNLSIRTYKIIFHTHLVWRRVSD